MTDTYLNNVRLPPESEIADRFVLRYNREISPHSFDVLDYEGGVISAHTELTQLGDTVVIVGGGYGITTVRAGNYVGTSGLVITYEGGAKEVETLLRTIELNNVESNCETHHAIVGRERDVYGDSTAAKQVHPAELPDCDVLELDCEGSEIDILAHLESRPRVLIVELHPWEYPERWTEPLKTIKALGYDICYRAGHDGNRMDVTEFRTLLKRSRDRCGTHTSDRTGKKYLQSGARWPVVIAAVR
jgi:hypothetical protein